MYIDTHAHLYLDAFSNDLDTIITNARSVKVDKIIQPNINLQSIECMLQICEQYAGYCYAAMGLHPCDVKEDFEQQLKQMEGHIEVQKCIAIGETGTDAYWDVSYWDQQVASFKIQLEWANQLDKPIIIHSRESLDRNIEIVREAQKGKLKGVFHCFNGTLEQANQIIDLGFKLGIGGSITYKNNPLKNEIDKIPLSSVVLETDAPFLSPVPNRGKRNEPSWIPFVAMELADRYGIPLELIAKETSNNARSLFKLS